MQVKKIILMGKTNIYEVEGDLQVGYYDRCCREEKKGERSIPERLWWMVVPNE